MHFLSSGVEPPRDTLALDEGQATMKNTLPYSRGPSGENLEDCVRPGCADAHVAVDVASRPRQDAVDDAPAAIVLQDVLHHYHAVRQEGVSVTRQETAHHRDTVEQDARRGANRLALLKD